MEDREGHITDIACDKLLLRKEALVAIKLAVYHGLKLLGTLLVGRQPT